MAEGIEAATCIIWFHAWFLYLHVFYPIHISSVRETIVVLYISCSYELFVVYECLCKKKKKKCVSVSLRVVKIMNRLSLLSIYIPNIKRIKFLPSNFSGPSMPAFPVSMCLGWFY